VLCVSKYLNRRLFNLENTFEKMSADANDRLGEANDRPEVDEIFMLHAAQFFFVIPCLVLTCSGYNSGFIFAMSLAFNLVCYALCSWLTRLCCGFTKDWINYLIYLSSQLVPMTMWSYMIQLIFIIFIPISGRKGTSSNPDILIGLAAAVSTFILLQSLQPVFISFTSRTLKAAATVVFVAFFIGLALMPKIQYSGDILNPAPKRMTVYHTRRNIGGVTDGGFLFVRSDYPDTPELYELVPEYAAAREITEGMCEDVIGCSVPVYKRNLESLHGFRWLNSTPPNFVSNPVGLEMSVASLGDRRKNLSLSMSGPNWSLLAFSPKPGVSFLSWSLSESLQPGAPWKDRDTYFINFIQGLNPGLMSLWLEVEVGEDWREEEGFMDASLTGHHHHGQESMSPGLAKIVAKFPSWVSLSSWTVDLQIFSL